jgi:hypothetical protein
VLKPHGDTAPFAAHIASGPGGGNSY